MYSNSNQLSKLYGIKSLGSIILSKEKAENIFGRNVPVTQVFGGTRAEITPMASGSYAVRIMPLR